VAIRCLDEGVDIPSVRTAVILASSSNPRQFIQRRGRVLRRFPGKKEATIFDMIVLPPKNKEAYYESEKRLVRNEFQRYLEFAELAVNAGEVRGKLIEKLNEYSMLDVKE
jgi:superfamily II DNA or RNA helicase